MAILTKEVTISEGSDEGKTFVVSQMPLLRGDRWANRAMLAVMKSGVDVSRIGGLDSAFKAAAAALPKGDEAATIAFFGMLDIAGGLNEILRALGGVDDQIAQELLDELLGVIKLKLPNGSLRPINPPTEESNGDIGDLNTLWKLRIEAIKVNLDFLKAGVTR